MDLINTLTTQLGLSPNAAQGAAGSVLSLIKQHAPADQFAAVQQKVPEADGWMRSAPTSEAGGGGLGGMLGGAAGALGGVAGGGVGAMAALTGTLGKLGIGAGSVGQIVPLVLQFLQARAGNDLVGKLVASVPFLSQFAGGGGGGTPSGGGGLGGALGGLFGGGKS